MFAPQNQEPDIIDAWSGTLQDWYDSIDNALTVSEIIPGNYRVVKNITSVKNTTSLFY